MKKYFYLLVLSALFVGCSSDGSREIQIDECSFVPNLDIQKLEDMTKITSIFEVVPGNYDLSWKLVDDLPQQQNYTISLNLKLRLKKHVDVKKELIDKISEAKEGEFPFLSPIEFQLLDANGQREKHAINEFNPSWSNRELGKPQTYNKDQSMDFLRFLQSEPGTEIELQMYSQGLKNNYVNCIEICEKAKGVICVIGIDDRSFERQIGTIQ